MQIRIVSDRNGYPAVGELLQVSDERGERWIEDGLAEMATAKKPKKRAKKEEAPAPAPQE